jgi:hypothetical protein
LYDDELHNLYSSLNIVRMIKSRRMGWVERMAHMGEGRSVYGVLVGRPKGEKPLGRPGHRWEVGIDAANCIPLAQDRVQWQAFVSSVMNLCVL